MPQIITTINLIITVVLAVLYAYQVVVYIPVSLFCKSKKNTKEVVPHTFGVMICARNEAVVIADLIRSIKTQTYPSELVTVFVMADNCTDNTAEVARQAGAVVYERNNKELVGKCYALEALMNHIKEDFPQGFDGYFVFDADNILAKDYIEQMNITMCQGHDILTSYRNSKNFASNWVSAGNALWFLKESRFLNRPRAILNTSCAVSGTGFLFSRKVAEELNGWPYRMMTEDIEFSISQVTNGRKIGFCEKAELYDEQPVSFKQSWVQRLRWAKGYLQVFRGYGFKIFIKAIKGSFSAYDLFIFIIPVFLVGLITTVLNLVGQTINLCNGGSIVPMLRTIAEMLISTYLGLFATGLLTEITEWKHIHASTKDKIKYLFTFPVFQASYIIISFEAIFKKIKWEPIVHTFSVEKIGQDNIDELISQTRTK